MLSSLLPHFPLLGQLIRRDIAGRYRGSALGMLWPLVNPLLMLAVYTFVFSVVFTARWPLAEAQPQGMFALILYAGLLVHGLAAEVLLRSPSAITAQVNYVKKVVFPLQILPLTMIGSALFHTLLGLVVLLAAQILIQGAIQTTLLWLPLIWLPYLLALCGASWILASLGVFLRDISQLMGLVVTLLLFLSPIFYPAEALPESYRPLLALNPLTVIITQTRNVLIWGKAPDLAMLGLYGAIAAAFAILGYAWFMKTRKGFADVL